MSRRKDPVPRSSRPAAAMDPVSLTEAPAWKVASAVVQRPFVPVSNAAPMAKSSASVKLTVPAVAAVPAASRVARDTVLTSFASPRVIGWPPTLRVSATRVATVMVSPAPCVIAPLETRRRLEAFRGEMAALNVIAPVAASPTRRTPVVVIRSSSPSESSRAAATSVKDPRSIARAAVFGSIVNIARTPPVAVTVPFAVWIAIASAVRLTGVLFAPFVSVPVKPAEPRASDPVPASIVTPALP